METSNMKNIVVLKNLPSNLIEEAIVILKENKKVTKLELVDKKKDNNDFSKSKTKDKQYILKEAEMLVSNYIDNTQPKKLKDKLTKYNKKSYDRLKKYSLIVTILLTISLIINLF